MPRRLNPCVVDELRSQRDWHSSISAAFVEARLRARHGHAAIDRIEPALLKGSTARTQLMIEVALAANLVNQSPTEENRAVAVAFGMVDP